MLLSRRIIRQNIEAATILFINISIICNDIRCYLVRDKYRAKLIEYRDGGILMGVTIGRVINCINIL